MQRRSNFLRAVLAAALLAAWLAAGTGAAQAAKIPGSPPPVPDQGPRDGDPDMPEWNSQGPSRRADSFELRFAPPSFWSALITLFRIHED